MTLSLIENTHPFIAPFSFATDLLYNDVPRGYSDIRSRSRSKQLNYTVDDQDQFQTVNVDLPGVNRNDVKLTLKKNKILMINAKRNENEFSYYVTLPETHDPNTVTAKLQDGVLSITFQKYPEIVIEIQ